MFDGKKPNQLSIILVVNRAQSRMTFGLYDKLTHIGKRPLILAKDNVDVSDDKKYFIRRFQYYQDFFQSTYFNIKQETQNLVSSLAKEKICKNLTFRELTKYKGVSLWELSAQYVDAELSNILFGFNMAETILNVEKASEVHLISNLDNLEKIFELICKKRQIPFFIHKTANKRALRLNKFFWKFIILAKKIKRLLVNLRFLFSNLFKFKNLNKKYKVLFFASIGRYLTSILPVIFKYNNEQRLVISMFSSSTKKLKEMGISYMDFYGYKPYGLFNREAWNLLKEIQDAIDKNSSFYGKLLYREVPIGPILRNLFEELIYEVFPHNMHKIDIARKILLSYRPKAIVVINYSVDVVLIAKSLSIPVVAIQNGFVKDLCLFGGPIIADAVAVDSNYSKEYLLKRQNVKPDKILVTGLVKFDLVLNNDPNIKDSIKILNFDNKCKKMVIFATDCLVNLGVGMLKSERIDQFKAVCRAIKNIKEAHLIIKVHPYEQDLNTYKKIAQETGLTNYSIVKNVEMLTLLRNCDLLITHISTAGYEAVLLNKDVISLFGSSKLEPEDIWDFKKYDATIVVDDLGELEKYIRSALFNPETQAKLKEGRKKYICEHAYKLDGNASGRVKEVIDSFISK